MSLLNPTVKNPPPSDFPSEKEKERILPEQYDFIIKLMNFTSISPFHRSWKTYSCNIIGFSVATYVTVLNLVELTAEYKGIESIGKSVFTPCILNKYLQYVIFILNYKAVRKPFEIMKDFWPWDKFGTAVAARLEIFSKRTYLIVRFYFWMVISNAIPLALRPLFLKGPTLFYFQYDYCDIANNLPCYYFSYILQIVKLFYVQLPVLLAFDLMFIAFIGHIYIQFELIKVALVQCDTSRAAIKEIVDQHNRIIDFIQAYDSWTSRIFLVKYLNIMGQLICSLYMLTVDEFPPSLDRIQTFGVLLMTMFLTCFVYSYGGALMKDQSESIAEAAYSMRWTDKGNLSIRNDVSFIIFRSQVPTLLTAGHIVINMDAFINVSMQNVISVYGLLATLAENEMPKA